MPAGIEQIAQFGIGFFSLAIIGILGYALIRLRGSGNIQNGSRNDKLNVQITNVIENNTRAIEALSNLVQNTLLQLVEQKGILNELLQRARSKDN